MTLLGFFTNIYLPVVTLNILYPTSFPTYYVPSILGVIVGFLLFSHRVGIIDDDPEKKKAFEEVYEESDFIVKMYFMFKKKNDSDTENTKKSSRLTRFLIMLVHPFCRLDKKELSQDDIESGNKNDDQFIELKADEEESIKRCHGLSISSIIYDICSCLLFCEIAGPSVLWIKVYLTLTFISITLEMECSQKLHTKKSIQKGGN
ncbi:12327_t:CDS:2 [Acaulospora morrowiae]|uniref:12327_t:CDS:1 n=1 Tax=Acaulospora morrowiae TaxID=94023 RepID=A0A9N9D9Z8_9GLOM|nr:12327_t:CDS:2 [Acaulospora morrowiae]